MNKRQPDNRLTCQHGFSMVELMIAILLGLFLMGGVLQLYSSNKTTFNNMEGISHIQDNARIGLERIKARIRMAGYMGCSNLNSLNPNNVTTGASQVTFNANVLITGTDNDSDTGNNVIDTTDTLNIITATIANTNLSTDMTSKTDDVSLVSNPSNFQTNDVIIITDCENADIFRATDVTNANVIKHGTGTVNSTNELSKPYLASSTRIMSLQDVTYTVEDTTFTDESGNAILSLFETPAGGLRVEIMSGVEDMQITYGEDTNSNGEADVYNDAPAVTNWANVVSVRLQLLISTARDIGPRQREYIGLDGNLVKKDRRMRRTFTTTIGLRNRSS